MKIAFSGSRWGMTERQKQALSLLESWLSGTYGGGLSFDGHTNIDFHHGYCIGSDEQAAEIMSSRQTCRLVAHPAKVDPSLRSTGRADLMKPPKQPCERNRDIVKGAVLLIAAPRSKRTLEPGLNPSAKREVVQ